MNIFEKIRWGITLQVLLTKLLYKRTVMEQKIILSLWTKVLLSGLLPVLLFVAVGESATSVSSDDSAQPPTKTIRAFQHPKLAGVGKGKDDEEHLFNEPMNYAVSLLENKIKILKKKFEAKEEPKVTGNILNALETLYQLTIQGWIEIANPKDYIIVENDGKDLDALKEEAANNIKEFGKENVAENIFIGRKYFEEEQNRYLDNRDQEIQNQFNGGYITQEEYENSKYSSQVKRRDLLATINMQRQIYLYMFVKDFLSDKEKTFTEDENNLKVIKFELSANGKEEENAIHYEKDGLLSELTSKM